MPQRLTLAAAVALIAAPAFAADIPARRAPAAPVIPMVVSPAFDWTGFYVGANAGWHWADSDGLGRNADDFTAGGTLGYNVQYGQYVMGLEGDWNWADATRRRALAGGLTGDAASSGTDWIATARARLGFAVDRFMVYGTGGFAFADVDTSINFNGATGGNSDTRWGWTLGAGLEYSLMNNWSTKVEYLYYQLESKSYAVGGGGFKSRPEGGILRAGLNYRF
jgi:outer membrane immunogenic protein